MLVRVKIMGVLTAKRFWPALFVAFILLSGVALACFTQIWIETTWLEYNVATGAVSEHTTGYWKTIQTNCGGGGHLSG